ncbi:hypothetical protein [Nocardioides ochotonae]|uniref:hypothetical protein n=1 Tax=Nocardioides ochotonae TaxID=2685869 RepID=UPI00140D4155|nr:hypothetical protein [Nocardioides ochotonae]
MPRRPACPASSGRMPTHRRPLGAPLGAPLASLLLAAVAVTSVTATVGVAQAGEPTQHRLCDGFAEPCRITTQSTLAAYDQILATDVVGNPGVDVALQFYAIEFNSDGAITGLVPSGAQLGGRTRESRPGYGRLDHVKLVPRTTSDVPGGWGFVGLADDTSIDLRSRLGQVVQFGGRTPKLLGDGYAEHKPAGVELDLHVVGHVMGVGYWVEYLDDAGEWVAVPGHGFDRATRLSNTSGEIAHLHYTVPATLTPGRRYQFRINHHLNFGGGQDRPISDPAYAQWTVVPSEHGEAEDRGAQFDPGLAPGVPDAPAAPGGSGGPGGPEAPATPSTSQPAGPAGPASPAPSTAPVPPVAPGTPTPAAPAASPTGQPTAPQSAQPGAQGSAGPGAQASARPSAPPSAGASGPADVVWGEEAIGEPSAATGAASQGVSGAMALLGALLLLAPLGWWWAQRRRTTRLAEGETL